MFLEQRTGKKYFCMFKPIDWIAIFVFTHAFYYGIVSVLIGGYIGGIILLVSWELWKKYEQYRQNNP